MEQFKTVPITLVTGYLGSGKTTLINYLLNNANGHKMAVIVNDIGEVNIDAELIAKGGVVNSQDGELVSLQNGCICCTLKKDLINQLAELVNSRKFDHILIEASGICEPVPIAQTISYMQDEFAKQNLPEFYRLDAIVSVVDALRLVDEFDSGKALQEDKKAEDDIANLVIQQIEFCNVIILNKVDEVNEEQLAKIKEILKVIQPEAQIIDSNFCKVNVDDIIDTKLFSYEKAQTSAGWIQRFEARDNEVNSEEYTLDDKETTTADDYGIGTFVYYRRRPFNQDKFIDWAKNHFDQEIIRSKGICYFEDEFDIAYIFESAGCQKTLSEYGKWYSVGLSKRQLKWTLANDENFAHDWDKKYGDRLIKLVFIGKNLNKAKIKKELDLI